MAEEASSTQQQVVNESKKVTDSQLEEETNKTFNTFLSGYTSNVGLTPQIDIIDNRYKIDLNSTLADFSSKNAIAYAATNIKTSDAEYVALVCEENSIQRTHIIQSLLNSSHPNLMTLVTAGVVKLSRPQEERLVFLYRKPRGKKLSELIAITKNRPGFEFICSAIIGPLALAIQHINDLGVTHGSINCDNIFYDTSGTTGAVIGPCVAEPCGFSQPFYYEPLERMQSLPAGKGEGDHSQDYYALAVVILHIIYGMNHFNGLDENTLIQNILKNGPFDALTRHKDMPEVFYDFFRGMLSYSSHDRWSYRYLKAWLDGKRYNVMPSPPPQEAIRALEFEDNYAYTRREVAHLFAKHWKAVPEYLENGQLSNWVAISLRNKELNEYVLRTIKAIHSGGRKNETYMDEQIMRMISVFDPMGPVRIQKLSFNIDGVNDLFASFILNQSEKELQLLMQFIEMSMFHFIIEQKNKQIESRDELDNTNIDITVIRLDRLRSIIRNNGLAFGVERIFYDLNLGIRCISPLLAGKHVTSLEGLLKALDSLAPALYKNNDPIDRHIAAFLGSHLGIIHQIHLTSLDAHPTLEKSQVMVAVKLLASAQRRTKIKHLPGITNWLAIRTLPLLEVIRSRSLKRKLLVMLANTARSGDIQKMEELLIDSGYANAEARAFQQAVQKYKQNASDIMYYIKKEMIETHSRQLGAKMAHYVAVAALFISFIWSVRGG